MGESFLLLLEGKFVDLIALELHLPVFSRPQDLVDFGASVVEEGVADSEVAEDGLLVGPDPHFSVAKDEEEIVVGHASEGSDCAVGGSVVEFVGLIGREGHDEGGTDQRFTPAVDS